MPISFATTQQYMREQRIDAWLVYDFRGSNAIFAQLLPGKRNTTRRALLLVPANGDPVLLEHGLDSQQFDNTGVKRERYLGWEDLGQWLRKKLAGFGRVAMEYAPGGALPVVSIVDAGTIELVRSFGVEVVSSANVVQVSVAVWSAEALAGHRDASAKVDAIKDEAFDLIRRQLKAGQPIHEYDVVQHITKRFTAEGMEYQDNPIVGVNAHSGNPHFEVSATNPSPIRPNDWVLIDLWARFPGDANVFSDITWVGFCGSQVPAKHQQVYEVVAGARDASVQCAQQAWKAGRSVQGWQLDDAARNVIVSAGFGQYIMHRTGHSLSPGPKVHGLGFNLDNLETHDTREMLPGLGFTIEPGVYLPEFGIRSEINMFVDPKSGPILTSKCQTSPYLLM